MFVHCGYLFDGVRSFCGPYVWLGWLFWFVCGWILFVVVVVRAWITGLLLISVCLPLLCGLLWWVCALYLVVVLLTLLLRFG